MSDLVKEWLVKAERDYATASRELQITQESNFDAVCFHAQQCIEKLMKALLIQLKTVPPKTHDLVYLSEILSSICSKWSAPVHDLRFLTRAAVEFRYPGETADEKQAKRALDIATDLKAKLSELLS